MPAFICITCGVQHAPVKGNESNPPESCPICLDDRQYVNPKGQQWTTLDELREKKQHRNVFRTESDPEITSIFTEPKIAIGQRALLVRTPAGNILWDCISYVDEDTVKRINELGGLKCIAISHPHFYSSMVEWSKAFGGIPVYVHAADRKWIMNRDGDDQEAKIVPWEGKTLSLLDGAATIVHCGGHFDGSCTLHVSLPRQEGQKKSIRNVLLTADTIHVVADRRWTTFMYSFPNMIPLPPSAVKQVWRSVKPFEFDKIYGGWVDADVETDAKNAVLRSAKRYLAKEEAAIIAEDDL
eukprot:GEZU01042277.1.p1 GENE.GEZU01042277.1~~GEZU01042277.1.p1  ORF type:complete len:297 (+),score=80.49 GEZU01042277.1:136-1026(+)